VDRAAYWTASSGVTADLLLTAQNTGDAAGDTYVSIENLQGSSHDDDLRGNNGGNTIWGGNGDDIILGRAGNDVLIGQGGNDRFVFEDDHGQDTIIGFEALNDLEYIDLSAVSAIADFADLTAHHLSQQGSDAMIDDLAGNTIRLAQVSINDLQAADFTFVMV
jgi:Ca2+-binding RTX toxin-like protein